MRLRKLAPKIALTLLALLFSLIVSELSLWAASWLDLTGAEQRELKVRSVSSATHARIAHENYNARFVLSENEKLVVEMDPEDPRLNSDGLRDREYSIEKPADTYRILALGDSVTYGHSISEKGSYVKQLETMLNDGRKTIRYQVINFGVSGYNTLQEFEFFRLKGRKYQPDLVMIGYTLNDVLDAETFLRILGGEKTEDDSNSSFRRSRLLSWIMDRASRVNMFGDREAFFVSLYDKEENWRIISDSFRELARIAEEDGFRVLVVVIPYLDGDFATYPYRGIHRRVREEALANGFSALDLLGRFEEFGVDRIRLTPGDNIHPGPEGHLVAANGIRAHIQEHLIPLGSANQSVTVDSVAP